MYIMFSSQSLSDHSVHPSKQLGALIRIARRARNCTIADLAEQLGRSREWLNRVELGYSEDGTNRPPTASDLQNIIDRIGDGLSVKPAYLMELGAEVERLYDAERITYRKTPRLGKVARVELVMGADQVAAAITGLLLQQQSDATIRNTGIRTSDGFIHTPPARKRYGEEIGKFLSKNPNALFKRVEFAGSARHLSAMREADMRLAHNKPITEVHNAKLKYRKQNPFQLHVLIGQREAIITFPQSSAHASSSLALYIDDRNFVEALRGWYDEVLWDGPGESTMISFERFEESFDAVKKMYGYE
jgi:transcriptional regulator with XRE-family HTH domain